MAIPVPELDPSVPDLPPQCDWAWRAPVLSGSWAAVGAVPDGHVVAPGARLFHDGAAEAVALSAGPGALALEVGAFAGSYLSLALDLPEAAVRSFSRMHIVQVRARVDLSGASGWARLNFRRGPNVVRVAWPLGAVGDGVMAAELDLGFTNLAAGTGEGAWLDLGVDRPSGVRVRLEEVVAVRRPRAEM